MVRRSLFAQEVAKGVAQNAKNRDAGVIGELVRMQNKPVLKLAASY
jgi:hypothetical protein